MGHITIIKIFLKIFAFSGTTLAVFGRREMFSHKKESVMKDSTGNSYIETPHTRITLVKIRPSGDKDWTGGDTLRIQARKGSGGLHMGSEIPIEDVPEILGGLAKLLIGG